MQGDIANLRVLVTAAGQGIGRAIAETFLAQGARVHICDIDHGRLQKIHAEHPELGITQADVADVAAVDALFAAVKEKLGGLDVLVNNAGVSGPTGPVEDLPVRDWDRTMAVNVSSQFYCARRAVPLLKAAHGGSIVNLSSSAGLFGYPLRTAYAASKWAVIGLTKSLAMELGAFAIRVNAICPGPVEGPRIDGVIAVRAQAQGVSFESMRTAYAKQNSLQTFIQAQDIANMVLFLCSPAGRKISGQALGVDGNTESLRL